ncbi:MAG: CRTAC1 family protein [Leeuwenhoekiella sp.]
MEILNVLAIMRLRILIPLLIAQMFFGCKEEPTMAEIIDKSFREQFNVPQNIYASTLRISYFDSISKVTPENQREKVILQKAHALLYAGKTQEAITILTRMWEDSKKGLLRYKLSSHEEESIGPLLAISYMRLGEQQNCIHHHDAAASCIIPIQPEGFHQLQQGSRKAIALYEEFLAKNSHDYKSKWLLNIAYMTLGEYPEKVPPQYLIAEDFFESEYPLKKFEDIAPKLGLNVNDLSGGGIVDDFNNDNLLDVLVSSWLASGNLHYFINKGDGTFKEETASSGLGKIMGGLNMVQADYNNDGFMDVFIMRGAWMGKLGKHPNSLLKNNGDNTFTDVTIEAGMLSFYPTQTASWGDFNNDGYIDLFIGNESTKTEFNPCELYMNNGDGTFSNKADDAGITVSSEIEPYYVKGVTTADYNNDGWVDVYVSTLHRNSKNHLFINKGLDNKGKLTFEEQGDTMGLVEKFSSFPTWSFDYDNDGWMDIFVAGYQRGSTNNIVSDIVQEYLKEPYAAETMRLFKNNNGHFDDVSKEVGLEKIGYAMGANYGDIDNDGYPDIYLSTGEVSFESIISNKVFRNKDGQEFQDVTTAGGFGHIQKGHAVSFSDVDNDGDQDIHVVMGGAHEGDIFFNSLYLNPYENENNWLSIKLEGTKANRAAIGSKIKVTILENGEQRNIYHTIGSGGSFGCSTLRAQIGLGQASKIVKTEVKWAGSHTIQQFEDLEINSFYELKEGGNPQKLDLKSISL